MALLDLSDVTRSLITLISGAFATSSAWTLGMPSVSPEPPARLTAEGVGIYLYHAMESKVYGSFPAGGSDLPPVRYLPMGLQLYYQLSASSILNDGSGAFNEQLMMGIAMKVLHDYPRIDDSTRINGAIVFAAGMRGRDNVMKVVYQPVHHNEAVNYWTAGASPIRLSAYYEVSVVFLEPETSRSYTGRVLSYGNYVFTAGQPRIVSTQNILNYTVPGQTTPGMVKLSPAQAPAGNTVDLFGTGFEGDRLDLLLLHAGWAEPALATPGWNLQRIASNQVSVTVGVQATSQQGGVLVDVLPGVYTAQLLVTRMVSGPSGVTQPVQHLSNQYPLIITPRIDAVNYPAPGDIITVIGFSFQPPVPVDIYIGSDRYMPDPGGAQGTFNITAPNSVNIRLRAGLTVGETLPVRILVRGAESPPNWITVH